MEIARDDPRNVACQGSQPLDRLTQRSPDGIVEEDGDERANVRYRRASRSWSRFRIPRCRSGSGSITSAARRSASAPSWSPCSAFSSPRAASARESSGTGAGAGVAGMDATSCDGAVGGALSDGGEVTAAGAGALGAVSFTGDGFAGDGPAAEAAAAEGAAATSGDGGAGSAVAAGGGAGAASTGAVTAGGAAGDALPAAGGVGGGAAAGALS